MDDLKVVHRSAFEKDPWRNIPETRKQNFQKHSDDKAVKKLAVHC